MTLLRAKTRDFIARLIVDHPRRFGRPWLIDRVAVTLGPVQPSTALSDLIRDLGPDLGRRVLLVPDSLLAGELPALLAAEEPRSRPYAIRAAGAITRRDPVDAKAILLRELLAGRGDAAVALLPEVAPSLNLVEAGTAVASVVSHALLPLDPYHPGRTGLARRALASILSVYPSFVDPVLAAASGPLAQALAGDIITAAVGRGGLLTTSVIPRVAPLIAADADELTERLRSADNRYSTADTFERAPRRLARMPSDWLQPVRARMSVGFRIRLLVLVALDVGASALFFLALTGIDPKVVTLPTIDLIDILAITGLLVALHVLAVELAAGSLAPGLQTSVAWPARLVSAYVVAALLACALLLPTASKALGVAVAIVLLGHVPPVARDLVSKADLGRAGRRIARDRRADFALAGIAAARAFRQRETVRTLLVAPSPIRRATTEPVTRRRMPLRAKREGYVTIDESGLGRIADLLAESRASPFRTGTAAPALVLLHDPGGDVQAGEVLAVLESDEPNEARVVFSQANRTVTTRHLPSVDRSRAAVMALARVHVAQSGTDQRGSDLTSRRIEASLRRFLAFADACLADVDTRNGDLENILPFSPEVDAVFIFETGWRTAIERQDDRQSQLLHDHALRMAELTGASSHSSSLDVLLARLDVIGGDASQGAAHSCAWLTADLAGIAAEKGKRGSFAAARRALEAMLDRMWATTPIPREAELVRQRLEEVLARGLIADYLLETQVERGCRKLVTLAKRSTGNSRQGRIAFGLAKIGGAALDLGRLALAAKIVFQLQAAGIELDAAQQLAKNDEYRIRMTTLSSLAGDVFGPNVGDSVLRFVEWAEALTSAFPLPSSPVAPTGA